eukprot:TRINITY_DN10738_c0_g1_i2.p1 TRINITY_DN10738_c0_g1~~TRINITY_DN10738_c0_g1_i2.p1  ORF type:complete len:276 (+),score=22.17 TRINITY_DN10738_c0_g1_i2:42-869(+)
MDSFLNITWINSHELLFGRIFDVYLVFRTGIIVISILLSGIWIIYFCNELWYIRQRYRRALSEVRDFVTENLVLDLKSRSMKNQILLSVCLLEINIIVLSLLCSLIPTQYSPFVYYYVITFTYLTFCLLNILTTYLTRVYTCKPDSRKDRRALIIFFIKLTLTILLSLLFYIIILPSLLVIFLFIIEFLYFIKNGRMLDRVIGWKQQDLSLEFGSEGRVLAIKRMRRRFNLFRNIFITCTSTLMYLLPSGVFSYYIHYSRGNQRVEFLFYYKFPT